MNRFNQIFTQQEYVPLVQPLPYDALSKMAEDMQKKADEDLLGSLKLKELVKGIKYDPADAPYVKQVIDEYTPIIDKGVDLAMKGDPTARKYLYEVQAKYTSDPRWNIISHNYELGKKARESAVSMKEQFKWSPTGRSDTWASAAASRPGLDYINWSGHTPWKEHYTDASRVMSGIKDTDLKLWDSALGYMQVDPKTKALVITKGGKMRGTDLDRINNLVNYNVGNYYNTEGGRSRYEDLIYSGASHEEALKQLAFDLYSVGLKQYNIERTPGDFSFAPNEFQNKDNQVEIGFEEGTLPLKKGADAALNALPSSGFFGKVLPNFIKRLIPSGLPVPEPGGLSGDIDDSEFPKKDDWQQKWLVEKASRATGRPASSGQPALDVTKKYLEDYGNSGQYLTYELTTDPTVLSKLNQRLFNNKQLIFTGDIINAETGKPTTAKKWLLGKNNKEATVSARLPLINPYNAPRGAVIVNSADELSIIHNPLQDLHPEDKLVADMGRSVFSPTPVAVDLPITNADGTKGTKIGYVDFERIAEQDLKEDDSSIFQEFSVAFTNVGIARVFDKDGNLLFSSENAGPQPDEVAIRVLIDNMRNNRK